MSDMGNAVEIDVTPKWWKPISNAEVGPMMSAMTEIYWAWLEQDDRFAAALTERAQRGSHVLAYNDRVVLRTSEPPDTVKAFCDALLDRLSSPGVEGKVRGRIALAAGDGTRAERYSQLYGQIFVTSRHETTDVLVEYTDHGVRKQQLLTTNAARSLFGIRP